MPNEEAAPNLKSASGAGHVFDDKVAALLMCEMLVGQSSLGGKCGVTQRLERQAGDWNPFDDLLLTMRNRTGKVVRCGVSVKSNRQLTANGCQADLRADLWKTMKRSVFVAGEDLLALFGVPISAAVLRDHVHALCKQAREEHDPSRLDAKVREKDLRQIYDSFRHPTATGADSLPRHALALIILREFDFEEVAYRSEAEAIRLCHVSLSPSIATDEIAHTLWEELRHVAEALRVDGGSITGERLTARLRSEFRLCDGPLRCCRVDPDSAVLWKLP